MLQTQPWLYLLLVFIIYWRGYKGRGGARRVVGSMNLFHLARGDMTNQKKGSREGLYGRKVHMGMSTDIWHSNSLHEVQVWLCMFVPLAETGVGHHQSD